MIKAASRFLPALLLLVLAVHPAAHAALPIPVAPEIDPSLAGSAVMLIAGATMVIRGRRRS